MAPERIAPSVTPSAPITGDRGGAPRNFGQQQQDRQEFRRGGDQGQQGPREQGRNFPGGQGPPTAVAPPTGGTQSGQSNTPGYRGGANPQFRGGDPQFGGRNPQSRDGDQQFGDRNPQFRGGNQFGGNRVLRNQTFANPAAIGALGARRSLANSTFSGRYAGMSKYHHRHHRGRVLGWFGPLFWPYAYHDVFDYAFYPYAYDTFWPYAYDDLYGGMFGPYAYGYGERFAPGIGAGPEFGPDREPTGGVQVCSDQASILTNWPIERIAETVQPTAAQMGALDQLRHATGRAVDILQSACPTRLPSTPTGRMATLQSRLESMLRAVDTIAPVLNAFYQSLDDEQRARFDAMGQQRDTELANEERRDLTQVCSDRGAVSVPIDIIAQAVRPDERQRAALDNLANASARAADMLRANCPSDVALTPVGRVDAMRQRLAVMLDAIIMVRPALEAFYNTLNYEQRARFNVIGGQEG